MAMPPEILNHLTSETFRHIDPESSLKIDPGALFVGGSLRIRKGASLKVGPGTEIIDSHISLHEEAEF